MKSRVCAFLVAVSLVSCAEESLQPGALDGEVQHLGDDSFVAWDAVGETWLDPEAFWLAYTRRQGGLTWGRRSEYPPYAEVGELDTLMIEVESGSCLMEFFHERWRRANDVRRWDPAFNTYAGCPRVFD